MICLQPDIELYKYTATSGKLQACSILIEESTHCPALKSHYVCTYPLALSLAVYRHAKLGCTARLSEVTGLSYDVHAHQNTTQTTASHS